MTAVYAKHVSNKKTPQSEPIPGKKQVQNTAGGFVFEVDDFVRLERFLILGSEGGSYYAGEHKLTVDNAQAVLRCLEKDGVETVRRIVQVSTNGRAPKNSPAIFALALAASSSQEETRRAALSVLNQVLRTGTHLFEFVTTCEELRGWSRMYRNAIAGWYTDKTPRNVAYQVTKYASREGWTHRDLFRKAHPKFDPDSSLASIAYWVVKSWPGVGEDPHPDEALLPIWAAERAKKATSESEVVRLITDYRLVRECVPTKWLNRPAVWEALLEEMPVTALVRNLGKMTKLGMLVPLSSAVKKVVDTLTDPDVLKRGRVHPLSLLVALKTYAQGHGDKGSLRWTPVVQVMNALDEAFYLAFGAVKPTNKRWLLALDVSGSMNAPIAGMNLSCREAAAALALVTAAVEKQSCIVGFSAPSGRPVVNTGWGFPSGFGGRWGGGEPGLTSLGISPKMRLDSVQTAMAGVPMGGTDCSLPMKYALRNKLSVDAFVVVTDNETWFSDIHPCQALWQYREQMDIPAKLIVVAMTPTGTTIADPDDAGTMDVVGFDTATPAVMSDFVGYQDQD